MDGNVKSNANTNTSSNDSDSETSGTTEAEEGASAGSEPLPLKKKEESNHTIETDKAMSIKSTPTKGRESTFSRQLKSCTNKKFLIKNQLTLLETAQRSKTKQKALTKLFSDTTVSLDTTNSNKVELIPSNIISIPKAMESLNQTHHGKFLLCRTLTPPVEHHGTLVVVDDPESEHNDMAIYLVLHNYIPEDTEDAAHILPAGSILAVKNPLCKKTSKDELVIYCDNPIEVRIFSEKTAHKLFPKVKWKTEIPSQFKSTTSDTSSEKRKKKSSVEEDKDDVYWRSLGNYLLKKYRYTAALEAFDKALELNPYDIDTIAQRSETFLRVKNYDKCLNDALAVLEEDPLHETAVYHKVHSLVGLRLYEDAISCLTWYTTLGKSQVSLEMKMNLGKLLEKVKTCYHHQKTGNYDFSFILSCPRTHLHECGEYIGPVEIVLFENKGRGTVAKSNISIGDIIHCTKAFTMGYPDENIQDESTNDLATKSDHTITSPFQKLVTTTAQRVMNDPESGKLIYRLYAGPDMKWLDGNDENVTEEMLTSIDMKRIDGICTFNAFYGDAGDYGENDRCCGIWTISSFINHSCYDANCCWRMYGDLLVVRATKDIPKGTEICTSYISPCELYPTRTQTFTSYGFVCDCKLCKIDRADSAETHQKRKHYTKKINKIELPDKNTKNQNEVLQVMEYYIEELIDLRPSDPHMNVYIINPLHQLAMLYYVKDEFSKAANILKHTHEIVSETVLIDSTLSCSINLISCYIRAKNIKKAKKAAKLLENDLYTAYGPSANVEILTAISQDLELVQLMEAYGVHLTFP